MKIFYVSPTTNHPLPQPHFIGCWSFTDRKTPRLFPTLTTKNGDNRDFQKQKKNEFAFFSSSFKVNKRSWTIIAATMNYKRVLLCVLLFITVIGQVLGIDSLLFIPFTPSRPLLSRKPSRPVSPYVSSPFHLSLLTLIIVLDPYSCLE